MPGRFTGSSAVLLVADLARSIDYYRDRLGFSCEAYGDPADFCVAERDDVTILMALCEEAQRIVPNWRIVDKVWNVYIRVDDVEAIYAELKERGAPIDYTIYNARAAFASSASRIPTATTSASSTNRP
jgi:predicted enzyme related to lactoylglutathione lyase